MSVNFLLFILIPVFLLFVWLSIKVAKHSFGLLSKSKDDAVSTIHDENEAFDLNINDFSFVADKLLRENEVVSTEEEIPLDNRYGSSPLISEHEFSRTVNSSFKLNNEQNLNGRIKTSLWTLIETEVKKNLTKAIGIEIGEQITRRVTVKLEAAPGEFVRYKLIWKQKQREGAALISVQNKEIQIPYSTTYGLFHSVESVK